MKISDIFICAALGAMTSVLCSCDNGAQSKKAETQNAEKAVAVETAESESPEELQARLEQEQNAAAEKAAREAAEKSQFLSVDFRADGLSKYGTLTALVDIKTKFTNPFDANDIFVDAYISESGKGISENVPLIYVGGESGKSTWQLEYPIKVAGSYKCIFGVRQKRDYENSREYTFNVSDSDAKNPVFKLENKGKSSFFFVNESGDRKRAIGASIPVSFTSAEKKNLLHELKKTGANTVRLDLNFISNMVFTSDYGVVKAGGPNMRKMSEVGEFLDEARAQGIGVIINFDSASNFSPSEYSKTYFSTLAQNPSDFFTNPQAQEAYRNAVSYFLSRFAWDPNILMWQIFSGLDAWDKEHIDTRYYSICSIGSFIKDKDSYHRPISISIDGSSDFDFLWNGEFADVIAFEMFDRPDFAESVSFHSDYFSKKYKKGVAIYKFGITDDSDIGGVSIHNGIWSSLFSRTPIIALGNFDKKSIAQDLATLKAAATFEDKFISKMKKPKVVKMPIVNVIVALKSQENTLFVNPAFSPTQINKEASTDIAGISFAADGTITRNTLPSVWKSNAIISFNFDSLPKGCSLQFKVESILKSGDDTCRIVANDADGNQLIAQSFNAASLSASGKNADGDELASVNKVIKVDLPAGKTKFDVMISSDKGSGYLVVSDMKITGIGSKLGFNDVKVAGLSDAEGDSSILWFRRGTYNNATYTKYKMHSRTISPMRSFEYKLPVGQQRAKYKVTWWDTHNSKEIASGEVVSDENSMLSFRTPPIGTDVVAVIEPVAK